jgi:hypothetical protein
VIFDNLHMMHDIISDILTADTIPYSRKGQVIDQQLDKLQDPTRDVMTLDEWRMMPEHMGGVAAMGGPSTGLLREVQPSSVSRPAQQPERKQHQPGMQHPGAQAVDSVTQQQHQGHEAVDTTAHQH